LKPLEVLSAPIDQRQLLLIRGRTVDRNFFRKQKTALNVFSDLEIPCLVWGASCLPKDEYENWIDTAKAQLKGPLGSLFLGWAKRNRSKLVSKLKSSIVDHPE